MAEVFRNAEAAITPEWTAPTRVRALTTTRSCRFEQIADRLPSSPAWLEQVHGADVVDVDSVAGKDHQPQGDAAVTRQHERVLAIRTADCLPVLFCHRSEPIVAAAHAGWRGLAAGVLENTVAAMSVDPDGIIAWLGPAISQAAFEVGPEVLQAFVDQDAGARSAFIEGEGDRWHADLYALARRRLGVVGVSSVSGGGFCTFTDSDRFPSYRRNPDCGRIVSLIWMRQPDP